MLQKIKDKDKDGMKELVLRHLSNLIDFAKLSAKGDIRNSNTDISKAYLSIKYSCESGIKV